MKEAEQSCKVFFFALMLTVHFLCCRGLKIRPTKRDYAYAPDADRTSAGRETEDGGSYGGRGTESTEFEAAPTMLGFRSSNRSTPTNAVF